MRDETTFRMRSARPGRVLHAAHSVEQCTTSFPEALSQPIPSHEGHAPPTLLADELPVPGGGWGGAQHLPQAGGVEGTKPSTRPKTRLQAGGIEGAKPSTRPKTRLQAGGVEGAKPSTCSTTYSQAGGVEGAKPSTRPKTRLQTGGVEGATPSTWPHNTLANMLIGFPT